MEEWADGLDEVAITVTDEKGDFIDMNTFSKQINLKPGQDIIGKNIMGCHNERSQQIINHIMQSGEKNIYTITKHGKEKIIYQSPWYKKDKSFGGLVEISMIIPKTMPHYDRDKQ